MPWAGEYFDESHGENSMSTSDPSTLQGKCALITGGAKRIGAAIASRLHDSGASIAIHYRGSEKDATNLCHKLNDVRQGSAKVFQADLNDINTLDSLVGAVGDWSGRIDALINNASSFYPTKIGSITEENWDELIGTNLRAPLFLSQAALPFLRSAKGCIVNIVDIHAMRPLRDHAVYGSAKAGLAMLTRSLAKDLAPDIRVNGVSPGAIMWPENGIPDDVKNKILEQVPLARTGQPTDIAGAVLYLVRDASYVTGQIIAIDGGRSLGWQ